ncbi:F2P16.13 PROTEIN-RELATED [Salix viminalis]|uniref:F2P16.13 PROTEIN-RELATED n=1 Tax=Salix viminalis TaxID=40686 RepID=A0A9Q0U770_SALVM|nr:F2P16.13 PROTEIN-RELATED [Salix viminalis]
MIDIISNTQSHTRSKPVMEALWNLEDKWKLTTQEAAIFFVCTASAVIGLCAAIMLKRQAQRKHRAVSQDPGTDGSARWPEPEPGSTNWITIRRVLMESMRWSEANKWEEGSGGSASGRGMLPPSVLGFERCESSMGWQSHNSLSAVWQRPILMGEKCELPRYSGLILYDERGRLLDHSLTSSRKENIHEEKPAAVLRTSLKDMLKP